MTDKTHNHFLDTLTELVGQENAKYALALADRARAHTASLLREASEAVDPGPDQRIALESYVEALAVSKGRIADLTTDLAKAEQRADEAEKALVARAAEINALTAAVKTLTPAGKSEGSPAQKLAAAEKAQKDTVVSPKPAE